MNLTIWLIPLLAIFSPGSSEEGRIGKFESVQTSYRQALVKIHLVVEVQTRGTMQALLGGEQEQESEGIGLMIEPGLVLCSNTQLTGLIRLQQRFLGQLGQQIQFEINPNRITIQIEGEENPLRARLLARDSSRDLAWLEITDPIQANWPTIPLVTNRAQIGESIVILKRLDSFYDNSLILMDSYISGKLNWPSELYIPSMTGDAGFGLPVFKQDGQFLGLIVLRLPPEKDVNFENTLSMVAKRSELETIVTPLIMPADQIAKATEEAKRIRDEQRNALP